MHDNLVGACHDLSLGDPESLAQKVFSINHAASTIAREKNAWKPTPANLLEDVQSSCVEHGHGGVWNEGYNTRDVVSIDMKSCYPASFQGKGEAAPWFQRFGHPRSRMTRVAINGSLPPDIATGFAKVKSWKFADGLHPVIGAWFGSHFQKQKWAPTALLAYMVETKLLLNLTVTEAIIAFKTQKNVWLPGSRNQSCAVIGKFTQGQKADCKRLTRRLVTDEAELDFLVRDCRQSGTLLGAPEKCPLGWILTYYDGSQPQYTHFRASMLAYAHINLLEMLRRFTPEEAVRVATDSIYVKKSAIYKLKNVDAYVPYEEHPRGYCVICKRGEGGVWHDKPTFGPPPPEKVSPAQWRDKREFIHSPVQHAFYSPLPEYLEHTNDIEDSIAPSYSDPLSRHQLSYQNKGGGSGKSTRAITLMKKRKPLVLTPTHRLAKEMKQKHGVDAQTYHSFFRYCGSRRARATPEDIEMVQQRFGVEKLRDAGVDKNGIIELIKEGNIRAPIKITDKNDEVVFEDLGSKIFHNLDIHPLTYIVRKEGGALCIPKTSNQGPQLPDNDWTPERMGQKYIPKTIIWDEICTVSLSKLQLFLPWLLNRGTQVLCCGDESQPPPICGESSHDWLKDLSDYYDDDDSVDYRAKCEKLKTLKKAIRLQPDRVQCQEMRKALPSCRGWNEMLELWHPKDMILVSRKAPRDRAQQLLFERHKEAFPKEPVPLLYHPRDSRRQNVMVTIPGSDIKQELVLNDIVDVSVETAKEVLDGKWGKDWFLGYALTVHSSQGLTLEDPQKVWIMDDYLQWSNLAYLAVSRVEYLHQLERCCPPPEESCKIPDYDEKLARKNIGKKLQSYKYLDSSKGRSFNLRFKDVLDLKHSTGNRCAACNIEILWCYEIKDTRQFSVDRIDNKKGHTRDNVRLTCLECNRKRGMAALKKVDEEDLLTFIDGCQY